MLERILGHFVGFFVVTVGFMHLGAPLVSAQDVVSIIYDAMRRPVWTIQGELPANLSASNTSADLKAAGREMFGQTSFDALGRPSVVKTWGRKIGADHETLTTTYAVQTVTQDYLVEEGGIWVPCSGSGQVCMEESPDGAKTYYSYDALNRVDVVTHTVASGQERHTKTVYDKLGRVTAVIDGWLSGGRAPIDTNMPADQLNCSPVVGSDQRCYQRYGYTVSGQVEWVADANGNKTTYEYDGFDRLYRTYFPANDRGAAAASVIVASSTTDYEEYHYDNNDNMLAKRTRKGDWIINKYDALNRLTVKKTYMGGTWDPVNRVMSVEAKHEKTVSYAYHLDGRDKSILQEAGADAASALPVGVRMPWVKLEYGYDGAGRQISETISHKLTDGTQISRTVAVELDAAGNRTQLTYPAGDQAGDTGSKRIQFTYDSFGRMDQVNDLDPKSPSTPPELVDYAYDGFGRRTKLTRRYDDNGTLYDYANDNALVGLEHGFTDTAVNTDVRYDYAHNKVNQITEKLLSNNDYLFQDQDYGNKTYAVNGLNQYAAINTTNATVTADVIPLYDGNGSLIRYSDGTYVDGGGQPTYRYYAYDVENRLVQVTNPSGDKVSFEYGPKGRRLSLQSDVPGSDRKEYLYEGDEPIADYKIVGTSSNLAARYLHGASVDERLMYWQYDKTTGTQDKQRYYVTDHQGSVVAMSWFSDGKRDGNPYRYDAFGNLGASGGDGPGQPFRYTGRRWDEETGLYYYRARYYSAELGRFLQTDPIGYEDNMNLYGYTNNDPVNNTDPTGEFLIGAVIGGLLDATIEAASQIAEHGEITDVGKVFTEGAKGAVAGAIGVGIVTKVAKVANLGLRGKAVTAVGATVVAEGVVGNDGETAAAAAGGKALDTTTGVALKAAEKLPKVGKIVKAANRATQKTEVARETRDAVRGKAATETFKETAEAAKCAGGGAGDGCN